MTLDDGKDLYEETDTHFGCDDGTATWLEKYVALSVRCHPCGDNRLFKTNELGCEDQTAVAT